MTVPYQTRHVESRITEDLTDFRIVALVGPRQAGKTTLVRRIAFQQNRLYLSLDHLQTRELALQDPEGFIRRRNENLVIDEIQRAPELFLVLKQVVDEDPQTGRFLITGSVDLFAEGISPDSLAGRLALINLFPFSRGEQLQRSPSTFLDAAFSAEIPNFKSTGSDDELLDHIPIGGYPEVCFNTSKTKQHRWFLNYARTIANKDIDHLVGVNKRDELRRLISSTALSVGGLVNLAALGSRLSVDSKTVDRWLNLLEQLFIVQRVPAWHHSDVKRLIKAPMLYFLDTGLLCALRKVTSTSLSENRLLLGPVLKNFVFSELAKTASQSEDPTLISHFKNKDGIEVDFVLERLTGLTVGIKVKSTVTTRLEDFRGLELLSKKLGSQFACGIVLHDGYQIQQISSNLFAIPVKMLWET